MQEFSKTPEDIQGQVVFQESSTKRVLIANSRTILGAQGRLASLPGPHIDWNINEGRTLNGLLFLAN